ncbi:hypothetical protein LTR94_026923, partial [Friedmanniomyces endolithicus]
MNTMSVTKRRLFLLPAAAATGLALATALAACDGENAVRITTTTNASSDSGPKGILKVVESLQCPDTMGALTRKGSANPGGGSCTYGGPRGSEVVLYLVKLDGRSAESVLRDYERRMSAEMPQAAVRINASETEEGQENAS